MEDKKGIPFAVFGIALIVVLVIGIGLGWVVGNKNEKGKENDVKETSKSQEEVRKGLERKMTYLFKMDSPGRNPLFEKNASVSDIEENSLISVALRNTTWTELDEKYECLDKNTKKPSEKCSDDSYDMLRYYLDDKEFKNIYEDVFGLKLSMKDEYMLCPLMIHNVSEGRYYLAFPCGGTGYATEYQYIYEYDIQENEAYVYVAYAVKECCGDKVNVYSDYEMKKPYKEVYSTEPFGIDSSNYKDFSHYKFVFEKKDNDYFFTRVEKV